QLLDAEVGSVGLAERRRWLEWTVASYAQLAALHQPPYGDRAVVLKRSGEVVGLCGLVPLLGPFGDAGGRYVPEVGLYWAVAVAHRRQGFATEAGSALVAFAFDALKLERLIATTTFDNLASIGVMRNLGMHIERNPGPEPPWLQVFGILAAARPPLRP